MRYFVTIGGEEHTLLVERQRDGSYRVRPEGAADAAEAHVTPSAVGCVVAIDGKPIEVVLDGQGPDYLAYTGGERRAVRIESEQQKASAAAHRKAGVGSGRVQSPMPGRVVKVLVQVGDRVEAGAPLLVMEAMKMENELYAGAAGRVARVAVEAGAAVERGATLLEIELDAS